MQPKSKRRPPTTEEVLTRQSAVTTTAPPGNSGAVVPAKPAGNLPAVPDTRTNVERYLDEVAPSMIVGRLVKFSKEGKFIANDTQEEIGGDEMDFICLADQTFVGWIKFNEETPPDRVMGLLYSDFVMPPRESLGDLDESQWPLGLSGAPADPWQHQQYLVLQQADTRELFTFVTSSRTGRSAVGNLLRHYDRMRKTHPDELPVIRLKTGGFSHKDERIGWVTTPVFVVCGRVPADSAVRPDTSLKAQLNDEIPPFD